MSERETFEAGTTIQITFVASVAPDGPPALTIVDNAGTIVATSTAISSSDTAFYGLFTTPNTPGMNYYTASWLALKTFVGSTYAVRSRVPFRVEMTEP